MHAETQIEGQSVRSPNLAFEISAILVQGCTFTLQWMRLADCFCKEKAIILKHPSEPHYQRTSIVIYSVFLCVHVLRIAKEKIGVQKSIRWGDEVDHRVKLTASQAWPPEHCYWKQRKCGRRDPAPQSCPVPHLNAGTQMHIAHTCTCSTYKQNEKFKRVQETHPRIQTIKGLRVPTVSTVILTQSK